MPPSKEKTHRTHAFGIEGSNLDLKSETAQSGVQKFHAECHACDWVGEVTARFRLVGPIAEPVSIH
jgi:hypothetical protein